MNHDWWLWVLGLATALHVMDEHASGWQGWAVRTFGKRLGVRPTWADFTVTNAALLFMSIATASVGWRAPWFALSLPALCLINAVVFHLLPSIVQKRPNPGIVTTMALYVPLSMVVYFAAHQDDVLSGQAILWSSVTGAVVMFLAIALLNIGTRFHYEDVPVTD